MKWSFLLLSNLLCFSLVAQTFPCDSVLSEKPKVDSMNLRSVEFKKHVELFGQDSVVLEVYFEAANQEECKTVFMEKKYIAGTFDYLLADEGEYLFYLIDNRCYVHFAFHLYPEGLGAEYGVEEAWGNCFEQNKMVKM